METLCRVCIEKMAKCTLLSTKIEKSSNLTFFDFLNKCTSINACESDKLPQSLCSICTHSVKTLYLFVKLAEKSDIIFRETLKNSIATAKYNDSREFTCEAITIQNEKVEEKSEDFNKEDSLHCQADTNPIESSLYNLDIVKGEPRISESTSIVAKINESDEFHSNRDHPEVSIEEPDDILSCIDGHLASIDAEHSDSENDVPISILKRRLVKREDETSQSNFFSKVHCIRLNMKEKAGKSKAKSKEILKDGASDHQIIRRSDRLIGNREFSCEEITIRNEKVEEESQDCNKEDSFHCHTGTNATGSSLYILDIVKEEPRISESTSIVAKIIESDEFHTTLDHPEVSIEEPDDIVSCKDSHLASIDAEHSDSEDDVPISILKRRLFKNKETDSQKTKIKNSHKCKECDMVFNDKEEFRTHCRNHICGDKHECNICGQKFARRKNLYNHIVIHDEKKKYKCSICGRRYKYASNWRRHMRLHNGGKLFECEICNNKFTANYNLKLHMEIHNGITNKCGQCDKEFKYPHGLRRHMKWHTNPKPFKCELCGRLLSDKCNYTNHTANCAGNSNEEAHREEHTEKACKECDIAFNDKEEFETHCRNHVDRDIYDGYKCAICGKGFKHYSSRRIHMRIHSDRKSFACEICSRKFARTDHLKRHMESHNEANKKCGQCGKKCKNSENLRKHMKWHTNPKPFKCENCAKLFGQKSNYTRHMKICKPVSNSNEDSPRKRHTENTCTECDMVFNDKEEFETHCRNHISGGFKRSGCRKRHMRMYSELFECEICGKKFKTKRVLKNHMEGHDGVTKKCNQCDKEFKYTKGLRNHLKWHTNPKPFKCELCGRLFASKFNLITHIKWHTTPKSFSCENCGKLFGKKCNYTRHMEICKPGGTPSSRFTSEMRTGKLQHKPNRRK